MSSRFPVRSFQDSKRAEGIGFARKPYEEDEQAFLQDACKRFVGAIWTALPSFFVPIPAEVKFEKFDTKIGGYQDYTIYVHSVELPGTDGVSLFVECQESMGYNADESFLYLATRGLPEDVWTATFIDLYTGIGFLDWKGFDMELHLDAVFSE